MFGQDLSATIAVWRAPNFDSAHYVFWLVAFSLTGLLLVDILSLARMKAEEYVRVDDSE